MTLPFASRAHAQDERDSASARALFEEGVKLSKIPDWPQAADRFERSLELRRSPVVAWNLATAWIELNRLVEASELLREIIRDEKAKKPLKQDAEKVLAEIEPRIGKLTVSIAEGSARPSEVRVNDRALPEASIGVAMPADPGRARVTALQGDKIVFEKSVMIARGGAETIEVALSAPDEPAPVIAPLTAPTPEETARSAQEPSPYTEEPYEDPEESDSLLESPIFWVAAGVLVAGGVVTAVLLASGGDETEKPVVGSLPPGRLPVDP